MLRKTNKKKVNVMNKTCHFASIERHHQFGVATYIIIHINLYHHFFLRHCTFLFCSRQRSLLQVKKKKNEWTKQSAQLQVLVVELSYSIQGCEGRDCQICFTMAGTEWSRFLFLKWHSQPCCWHRDGVVGETNKKREDNQQPGFGNVPVSFFLCWPPPKSFSQVTK